MGVIEIVLFTVFAAAFLLLLRRTAQLRREVREAESRLARRFYLLQGRVTEIDSLVRELDFERRRRSGEIRFEAKTRLSEAFSVHPRVREIFAGFGITGSGCAGGSLDETQTITEACAAFSLDARVVLETLGRFLEDPVGPVDARASAARIYRIQAHPGAPR